MKCFNVKSYFTVETWILKTFNSTHVIEDAVHHMHKNYEDAISF